MVEETKANLNFLIHGESVEVARANPYLLQYDLEGKWTADCKPAQIFLLRFVFLPLSSHRTLKTRVILLKNYGYEAGDGTAVT